jgi:hypothetical protein
VSVWTKETAAVEGGLSVSVEDALVLSYEAVIVAVVTVETAVVGRLKDCEVAPDGIVTVVVGKAGLELVRVTAAPPLGAGAERLIVTLTLLPPVTEVGDAVTDETATAAGSIVTVAEPAADPSDNVAVTVTVSVEVSTAGAL